VCFRIPFSGGSARISYMFYLLHLGVFDANSLPVFGRYNCRGNGLSSHHCTRDHKLVCGRAAHPLTQRFASPSGRGNSRFFCVSSPPPTLVALGVTCRVISSCAENPFFDEARIAVAIIVRVDGLSAFDR